MVVMVQTEIVIAQHLDHTAIRHLAVGALLDHPLQFGFELAQPGDPGLDLTELTPGDPVRCRTGQFWLVGKAEQFPDGLQRKPEFTGMADESQPFQRLLAVKTLIARATFCLGQ